LYLRLILRCGRGAIASRTLFAVWNLPDRSGGVFPRAFSVDHGQAKINTNVGKSSTNAKGLAHNILRQALSVSLYFGIMCKIGYKTVYKLNHGVRKMECTNCGNNCKILATQDIIQYCREHFEIDDTVSDKTMREKIKSVVGAEKWAAAEERRKGKPVFLFTQDELQQIVFETPLYDYMLERASERSRVAYTQGMPFLEWWNDVNIGEGYDALASKLVDLSFNLCMQLHGEGLLPPLPPPPTEIEEKADAIFEVIKQGLMFYPQFADMFGGESVQETQSADERQAERIADLVAQKLVTKPPQKAEPRPQNKHNTFGE